MMTLMTLVLTLVCVLPTVAFADADPPQQQQQQQRTPTPTTHRLLEFIININDPTMGKNVLNISPLGDGFGMTNPNDGKPVSPLESQARESDRINKLKEGAKQLLRDAHNAKAQAQANAFSIECERLRLLKKYADKNFVGFDDYPAEIRNLVKRLLVLENYFIKDHCPVDAAGNIKEDHSGHGHTH